MRHEVLLDLVGKELSNWEIVFRVHATRRMFQRAISESDLFELFRNGVVIEEYPDDSPFPSTLINGQTLLGRKLHAVLALDFETCRLYVITVYEPDPLKWIDGFSRRK